MKRWECCYGIVFGYVMLYRCLSFIVNSWHFTSSVVFRDKWIYVQKGSTKEVSTGGSLLQCSQGFIFFWLKLLYLFISFFCVPTETWILHTWWSAESSRLFQCHTGLEKIQLRCKSEQWRTDALHSASFWNLFYDFNKPLFHLLSSCVCRPQLFQLIARSQLTSLSGAAQKNYFNILEKIVRKGKSPVAKVWLSVLLIDLSLGLYHLNESRYLFN